MNSKIQDSTKNIGLKNTLKEIKTEEVTADDIIHGSEIEVINPEQHICTVAKNGPCSMTIIALGNIVYIPSSRM